MIFMKKYIIEFRMLSILHYCVQCTLMVGFFLRYTTTSNVSQYSNAIQYYGCTRQAMLRTIVSTTSWFDNTKS